MGRDCSQKTGEIVAPNREPGYGSVAAVPTKRGPSVVMRDPVREQVPGFTLSSKKPFDKHASAAKAEGGMQPPVAATKAGVGFQPPSANVHFLPSPITRCCCGICTQDASGSKHFVVCRVNDASPCVSQQELQRDLDLVGLALDAFNKLLNKNFDIVK